ncbi:helix-turn-helix domain-containing protein [Clostridiaceae bacterium M8S5]|nr:helix-turn-helix domain-containing protein [Clostridiaceae bacterium M8S5]
MQKFDYLKSAIKYIEAHLYENIKTDYIANICYVSCMQLYRDFYAFTGHSVKEYIRKRRLSNALSLIKFTNKSISDIAYTCGYSSQQAFNKYVKKAINQTPLEYKYSDFYYFFPCFKDDIHTYVYVSTNKIPKTINFKFYHHELQNIENNAIDYFLSLFPNYSAKLFGRNTAKSGELNCYELSIPYNNKYIDILEKSIFREIKSSPPNTLTYATLTVQNDEESINNGWNYLYTHWIKNSMFTQNDTDFFEEFIIKNKSIAKLKLHLPIKKKQLLCDINIQQYGNRKYLVSSLQGNNAEATTSKVVLNYVNRHYPNLFENMNEFIVIKTIKGYMCGIRIPYNLNICEKKDGLKVLVLEQGSYARLESICLADSQIHIKTLLNWISSNSFTIDNTPIFTIYNTNGTFNHETIRMTTSCKIKC